MAEYKGNYRCVPKKCKGCKLVKEMPTRNVYCSRECRGVKATNGSKLPAAPEGGPKILILDIETFPNLAYIWGVYEQNALSIERHSIIATFSAKWLNGEQITLGLPDYEAYEHDQFDDRELLQDMWQLLDEADICVAHNGDSFDFKKLNARFIHHGMNPPAPYRTVDTLKIARRVAKFESNKLNDLGVYLSLGEKVATGGFKLWQDCMTGKADAWGKMKEYNAQDVLLLEKVYLKFLPWTKNHPNVGVYNTDIVCPKCGSDNMQSRGFTVTNAARYRRLQCQGCGGWSRDKKNLISKGTRPLQSI